MYAIWHLRVCSLLHCSAFTPPPTSDVISPGLVDDGVKCASGKMCYEQRCISVSNYQQGLPQCPTGSNGRVCSGNGVRMYKSPGSIHLSFNVRSSSIRCATIGDSARAMLDIVAVPVLLHLHQVCIYTLIICG